jgi:hypothetical protein
LHPNGLPGFDKFIFFMNLNGSDISADAHPMLDFLFIGGPWNQAVERARFSFGSPCA